MALPELPRGATRRSFLRDAGRLAAAAAVGAPAAHVLAACADPTGLAPTVLLPAGTAADGSGRALRVAAAARNMRYGAAVAARHVSEPAYAAYAKAIATECNILVPENDLKWGGLRPVDDHPSSRG